MSPHVPSAAEIVLAAFPGKGFIPIRQAGEFIGLAYQTSRHHLAAGTFPLRTIAFGKRKRLVPVSELIRHYAAQLELAGIVQPSFQTDLQPQPKRRPGRPRKVEGGAA